MLNGKLFLIVGPSGSGKGTIIKEIQKKYKGFVYPVSCTTRGMREGEESGDVYHFISKDKFQEMIAEGKFLEYAIVHSDNYYGTAKDEIVQALESGAVVIREVDIQGFHSIQKLIPKENLVSIFMKVGDLADLKTRIMARSVLSEHEMEERMISAKKELAQAGSCDYQVDNKWGAMGECLSKVEAILLDEIKDLY